MALSSCRPAHQNMCNAPRHPFACGELCGQPLALEHVVHTFTRRVICGPQRGIARGHTSKTVEANGSSLGPMGVGVYCR
eukprot:3484525-Alexandrium_andersonii.AAC.1